MSAESPRRGSRGGGGALVRPQPVSDKTVMESVVDFFQDVAYSSGNSKPDDREKVLWLRFEQADVNDITFNPDCAPNTGNAPPLLLVLGYSNGVQIWNIPASGEAQEVLSIRQGPVRILRLLPNPQPVFERADNHQSKRPLLAVCDATSAGPPFCSVKFVSLRTGDEVHNISFNHNAVTDVQANERAIVVAFSGKIVVFDACQFKQLFWITSCFPCLGPNPNPIALGSRWLAYADKKLVAVHQSYGGMTGDLGQSYAATVISAAKTLTKGLTMFGETVASSITGTKAAPSTKKDAPTVQDHNGCRPGIVTVIDIQRIGGGQVAVQENWEGEGLVAHFPAHATEPVSALKFDPSGAMLLSADRLGHNFHLYHIMAHPWSCSLGAVHHLYTLHRGDTTAKVQDIAFTHDSRWVAISTLRGTTHVFPVTPYGGPVTVRTHMSTRVVNRASRFHRSAGLEDINPRKSGRDSPVLSGSPGSSPGRHEPYRHVPMNVTNNTINNPRLPPFPHPTTVYPHVQIRQTLAIPGLGSSGGATVKPASQGQAPGPVDCVCIAACFARSRGWVAGSPTMARDKPEEKKTVDSLYLATWSGNLIEYVLDPHTKAGPEKITDESPLEVTDTPRAQWHLVRTVTAPEVRPPLPNNNPLLLATDAVVSQRPSGEVSLAPGLGSRNASKESLSSDHSSTHEDRDDHWLSQVEIITHTGPHRRLWMGPQFSFKTFQGAGTATILASNSSVLQPSVVEPQPNITAMDIVTEDLDLQSLKITDNPRSSPMAMPGNRRSQRLSSAGSDYTPSPLSTYIEAGSLEQSPRLLEDQYGWVDPASVPVHGGEMVEEQLREHLADAMNEYPNKKTRHSSGRELDRESLENLSTSSGSSTSINKCISYDARSSPPHSIEHVPVFPAGTGNGSPD